MTQVVVRRVGVARWFAVVALLALGSWSASGGHAVRGQRLSTVEIVAHYIIAPLRGSESWIESRVVRAAWLVCYALVVIGVAYLVTR